MELIKLDLVFLMIQCYLLMVTTIIVGLAGSWWLALLSLTIVLSVQVALKHGRNNEKI
jgi:hypothetical protein